jgi:hypothetical protein
MRCPSKKAPCGSMSCWFIYTPHHLYSILYIKVTIRGTLPNVQEICRILEMSEFLVKEYIAIIEEHNTKEEKITANASV